MRTILVISSDRDMRSALKTRLMGEGFRVDSVLSAYEGLALALEGAPSLVILERELPDGGGLDLCEAIHRRTDIPILLVGGACGEDERVAALSRGADDILTMPFGLGELVARAKALIRRYARVRAIAERAAPAPCPGSPFTVDMGARTITLRGEPLSLTSKEFDLLMHFLQNPGRVFAKSELYSRIWDADFEGDTRTVMVYISRLRKKIERTPEKPEILLNVWGVGYKLNPTAASGFGEAV